MLSPLTANASMGEIGNLPAARQEIGVNNAYIPRMPGLPPSNGNSYDLGAGKDNSAVFSTGKGSVIKRDSIVFKSPSDNGIGGISSSNYRNYQAGIQNTLPPASAHMTNQQ